MKLKELYKGKFYNTKFIGLYETDSKGIVQPIHPEYAGEILETHGDKEVLDYQLVEKSNLLVVELD